MPQMKESYRAILLVFLSFVLSSCSGSSGGGAASNPGGSQSQVAIISSTTVSADSSVPASVVIRITEVVSPVGSGTLSATIQIATSQSRDSFVLAVDASGKIWLASVTSTGTTNLSAESTALALVRMAIGALPSGLTASQANEAIRATAEFPALVSLIQAAFGATQAPLDSGPVVQSMATAVRQAMNTLSAILAPRASGAPGVAAFASTPVDPARLPAFNILSNFAGLFSVYVQGAGSGGSVNVVNASPIVWSAHSLDETGRLIPAPPREGITVLNGSVLLEANSVVRSLLDKVHPWLGPQAVNLPGNSGKGLDLVVEQTSASRRDNLSQIVTEAVASVLPIVAGDCLGGAAGALIGAGSLDEFARATSFDFFRDAMNPTVLANDDEFGNIISTCAPNLHPSGYELGRFGLLVGKALTGLAAVQAFDDAATLAAKVVMTATHWNTHRDVAVCMGETGIFRTPSIQNCITEFRFESPAPILVPNARFTPGITALAAGDVPTGLPIGVTHSSSDAAQAVLTVLTPQTGELVASGPGSAVITVRDPFTNASGQYHVTVVRPVIRPGVVRMGVGQAMSLSLTDASGNLVITDGSGLTWTLENETRGTSSTEPVAVLGPFSGGATNTATIYARAPGRITATVRIPASSAFPITTAEVEVLAAPLNVCELDVPSYAPSGCELPRLIARNPYTPIPSEQPIAFSELVTFSSGTCGGTDEYFQISPRGSNWRTRMPEPYSSIWTGASFITIDLLRTFQSPGCCPNLTQISLETTGPGLISMPVFFRADEYEWNGVTSVFVSLIKVANFTCTFRQESATSGP